MSSLRNLLPELLNQTLEHLEFIDKLRLSSTCSHFRGLLAPQLFQTVHFTSKETKASSALLTLEKYGQYTTQLSFTGHASPAGDNDNENGDSALTSPVLPQVAKDILGGSEHAPNLRSVHVKFEFDFDDGDDWDDNPEAPMGCSIYVFDVEESDEYVRDQESRRKWRALMNEVWAALATNQLVKELVIQEFVPKWTSAFRTVEFQQFLGQLESFSIAVLGMDNGAGWKINKAMGYNAFLEELDTVFFTHMESLKHLTICAAEEGPIGLEGYNHIPLALNATDLPSVETLELQTCFIGPELVSFMRGHVGVLKALTLKNCVSGGDGYGMADNAIFWSEFFNEVRDAKPTALSELVLEFESSRVPLTNDEEWGDYDPETAEEPDHILEIRRILKDNLRRRVFPYAHLDDKYGMFFMDEEGNVEAFQKGEDQKAYNELMKLVKSNASKV